MPTPTTTTPGRTVRPRDVIRRLRTEAGRSQADLARGAGISRALMCEIEAGTRGITPQVIRHLATALGVAPTTIDPTVTDPAAAIDEPLLSVPDVAARLSVSRPTVYRLLHAGELDRIDIGSGSRPRPRVPLSSLTAYIRSRTVPGRRTTRRAA